MKLFTTKYALGNRLEDDSVLKQNNIIESHETIKSILNALSIVAVILNEQRQIVYANKVLIDMLGIEDPAKVFGTRPGEAFNCVNSTLEPGGCGTSENCRYCGVVNSILESQLTNSKVTKECRITTNKESNLNSYDFSVTSTPVDIEEEHFTILSITDIGEEKRKRALEKIFFHDVINTAGGLSGFIEYLRDCDDDEEIKSSLEDISKLSVRLLEEIISQRDLASAESNELAVIPAPFGTAEFIESIHSQMLFHPVSEGKIIKLSENSKHVGIVSDQRLLGRVVTNMLKNAVEASKKGDTITLGTDIKEDKFIVWVNNVAKMPREIELQVFQRSFSTKGQNRGLGTYSMKLIGEKYLGGKVSFITNQENGTTFFIELPINSKNN